MDRSYKPDTVVLDSKFRLERIITKQKIKKLPEVVKEKEKEKIPSFVPSYNNAFF